MVFVTEARIEIANVHNFQNAFQNIIEKYLSGQIVRIVLVMEKVEYIDSSALGALISIARKVENSGSSFFLSRLPEHILGIFKIAKIDTHFNFYET